MPKILIVEDDRDLCNLVSEYFAVAGYTVDKAFTGADGRNYLKTYQYDVIILDWSLPEITGIALCKEFRAQGGNCPVVFLTGKTDIAAKETGLDAGSDDYVTKPFSIQELAARVRALLRRSPVYPHNVLKVKDIELDPNEHKVTKNGQEVKLFPREFALLEFFMRHPNQVFSADTLIDRVWQSDTEATAKTVRVSLMRLRQGLDEDKENSLIKNVYGVGYKLET